MGDLFMHNKRTDSKGRLTLGPAFANMIFIVNEIDSNEIILKKAVLIPQNEIWLHQNESVMDSLQRGLKQAKNRQFGKDPLSKKKNMNWLDEIED